MRNGKCSQVQYSNTVLHTIERAVSVSKNRPFIVLTFLFKSSCHGGGGVELIHYAQGHRDKDKDRTHLRQDGVYQRAKTG